MKITHPSGITVEIPDAMTPVSAESAASAPTTPSMPMKAKAMPMMPAEDTAAEELAESPQEEATEVEESVDDVHGGVMVISDPDANNPNVFQFHMPKE